MGNEVERKVERSDRSDDTNGPPQRERELSHTGLRGVHRHHVARELSRLDGGERVRGHRSCGFDASGLHRLPRFRRDRARCLFVALAEVSGNADEDLRSLVRGQRLLHRRRGCVDRPARLGRSALGHPADDVARVRRPDVEPIARLDPLSVHEQALFGDRDGHAPSLGNFHGMTAPETRYAKSGDVNIAYQVIGEGVLDVVLVPGFVSHLEIDWELPSYAHFFRRLASFSRLILFDKRGTGSRIGPAAFLILRREWTMFEP